MSTRWFELFQRCQQHLSSAASYPAHSDLSDLRNAGGNSNNNNGNYMPVSLARHFRSPTSRSVSGSKTRTLVYSLTLNTVYCTIPMSMEDILGSRTEQRISAYFCLSWFDTKQGHYFGKTFKSAPIEVVIGEMNPATNDQPHATLNGRNLSINFAETEMLVHSGTISASILIIVEFSLEVTPKSSNEQSTIAISCGWTAIQPWMGSVGAAGKSAGLNIWQYLREQDQEVKNQLGQKLLTPTLLSGSPRVLALCCPGDAAERPLESLLNGLVNERNSNEVCKCKLAVEPEMQSFSNFVPEFLWIGPDDDVPGLQLYPIVKPLQQTTSVRLQDINVRFPIEIDQFETMFTDRLREQFEAVKDIEILDRRLSFKLHNGFGFFHSGLAISLQPSASMPDCLQFTGSLELDEFPIDPEHQQEIAAIVMLEYSFNITHFLQSEVQKKRKWLFTRKSIINKVTGSEVRNLAIGWAAWIPETQFLSQTSISSEQQISTHFEANPDLMNPFFTAIYSPQLIFASALAKENALIENVDARCLEMFLSFSVSKSSPKTAPVSPTKEFSGEQFPSKAQQPSKPSTPLPSAKPPSLIAASAPDAATDPSTANKQAPKRHPSAAASMPAVIIKPEIEVAKKSPSIDNDVIPADENDIKPVSKQPSQPFAHDKENISFSVSNALAEPKTPRPINNQVFTIETFNESSKRELYEFSRSQLNRIGRADIRPVTDRKDSALPLRLASKSVDWAAIDPYKLSQQTLQQMQNRLNKALHDSQMVTVIGIGLLGFTPVLESFKLNQARLSFQFFNFQYCETARPLIAINSNKLQKFLDQTDNTDVTEQNGFNWPNLFLQTSANNQIGAYFDFRLDMCTRQLSAEKPPRIHPFIRYAVNRCVSIDVWDGESQILVGTARFPASLFLEGWMANTSAKIEPLNVGVHVPIYPTDWAEILSSAENGDRRYSSSVETSGAEPVGYLHLQLSNVLKQATDTKTNGAPTMALHSDKSVVDELQDEVLLEDYMSTLRIGDPKERRVQALRLIEADSEYRNYLQSHAAEMHIMRSRRQSANEKVRRSPAESQKLEAILRYLVEKNGHIPSAYMDEQSHQEMRNDRLRQLQIACDFRQEKKQFYLRAALMEQITSTHQVHVRPGQAYFFEFRLTNPFTIDQTVEISFDSLDLRLVTDVNEWKYLQRAYGIQHATVEKDMVAINQNSTLKEVWLRANESLAIPFVFQSPISDYYGESVLDTNTVHVSFVNADTKRPLAFLNLEVHPHSGMEIDQTLRFFGCEGELLKAQMRYTPRFRNQMDSEYNPAYDLTEPGRRFIRCSDDGVICRVDELRLATENSNAYSINIKYRCRESSAIPQKFYIFFYYDPFFTNLGDVWQVFVHSLHRMDVSCWYGQTNQASLILRGSDNGSRGRTLKFFSSSCAEEIKFCKPKIELVGNALNEVEMNIRSKKVGVNDILVNVVDSERSSLLQGWIVRCHTAPPAITKEFSLQLPFGKASNKRVAYRNPYSARRKFFLQSSQPQILSFKSKHLVLDGGKSDYIHLQFQSPKSNDPVLKTNVLVLINNEQDKVEECLNIILTFA